MLSLAAADRMSLGLLILDIDSFKQFNNDYHHSAGDVVIRDLAVVVKEIIGDRGVIARTGGAEFGVLLPGAAAEEISQYAELLRAAAAQITAGTDEGRTKPISVTIGAAWFPDHADDFPSLMEAGKNAVYRGKAKGRDCVAWAPSSNV